MAAGQNQADSRTGSWERPRCSIDGEMRDSRPCKERAHVLAEQTNKPTERPSGRPTSTRRHRPAAAAAAEAVPSIVAVSRDE
jgi:hypothetical protein